MMPLLGYCLLYLSSSMSRLSQWCPSTEIKDNLESFPIIPIDACPGVAHAHRRIRIHRHRDRAHRDGRQGARARIRAAGDRGSARAACVGPRIRVPGHAGTRHAGTRHEDTRAARGTPSPVVLCRAPVLGAYGRLCCAARPRRNPRPRLSSPSALIPHALGGAEIKGACAM